MNSYLNRYIRTEIEKMAFNRTEIEKMAFNYGRIAKGVGAAGALGGAGYLGAKAYPKLLEDSNIDDFRAANIDGKQKILSNLRSESWPDSSNMTFFEKLKALPEIARIEILNSQKEKKLDDFRKYINEEWQ